MMHRQSVAALPEIIAVALTAQNGNLGLGNDTMYRMADEKRDVLAPELLLEALNFPLLPKLGVDTRSANAQQFFGGAGKELMLLLLTDEGAAKGSHAGEVALEETQPGISAVIRVDWGER